MTEQKTHTSQEKTRFMHQLRKVLAALYDPVVLRNSPLIQWLDVTQQHNAALRLRRALTEAIESLRPSETTPHGSRTWRVYQILRRRYTEQLTQHEVATDLGLSVRQLQREEKLAREVLADHLWRTHNLETKFQHATDAATSFNKSESMDEIGAPTRAQELERLSDSISVEIAHIEEIIQEVLSTLSPLLQSAEVRVYQTHMESSPPLLVKVPILRQALLNLISIAIRSTAKGCIQLQLNAMEQHISISIHSETTGETPSTIVKETYAEPQNMATQLIALCQGNLDVQWETHTKAPFSAKIILPTAEQATVLAIDDNTDVLLLFDRYLSGTQYRFISAENAQKGLELADTAEPDIIILDVMMPGEDGWTLLGKLREHPKTQDIPIIVCSILSQEDLAMALGAATFIRKPVQRDTFLTTLNQQLSHIGIS